jgi:hypothetical protein
MNYDGAVGGGTGEQFLKLILWPKLLPRFGPSERYGKSRTIENGNRTDNKSFPGSNTRAFLLHVNTSKKKVTWNTPQQYSNPTPNSTSSPAVGHIINPTVLARYFQTPVLACITIVIHAIYL